IDQGYSTNEISDLLVRIYREQKGGAPSVAEYRRERRSRLKLTLTRLRHEAAAADLLRQIAAFTLSKLSFNHHHLPVALTQAGEARARE
ncbi:MAG: hypothetical protein ABII06_04975, partial [Pseudomonadota bacterium]